MPAPQSTAKVVKKSVVRRRYTLAEANRSLPLVSRIVGDIVNAMGRITELQGKLEEPLPTKILGVVEEQLEYAQDRLQDYMDELSSLGIELKNREAGLIDFPGRHQGRNVYLCWRLGEEKVAHWHEMHAGFAGRQAVEKLEETA